MIAQHMDLRRWAAEYAPGGQVAEDEHFFAEQYYRPMFDDRAESWNLRNMPMMETLEAPMEWTRRRGRNAGAIVWAHNSPLGGARATQMANCGEVNLGQVRQRFGREAFLIGFTTRLEQADLPETYPVGV